MAGQQPKVSGKDKGSQEVAEAMFQPLTPAFLTDKQMKEYKAELDLALSVNSKDQVRNIALTGGFGVGKSSIIQTYIGQTQEHNFVTVSMARFGGKLKDNKDEEPGEEEKTEDRGKDCVEQSIVEQLLYSESPNKLPLSRFRRISQLKGWGLTRCTTASLVTILSATRLYDKSWSWFTSALPPFQTWSYDNIPKWLALLSLSVIGTWGLSRLIRFFSGFSINKIGFKETNAETISKRSALQENLDELLYYFEQSDKDVVVFEDMDRLESAHAQTIFTHLREINRVLNQSPQIQKPIFFVYAVKDELFSASDKAKFFDQIIPVIPAVHASNAYSRLKERLEGDGIDLDDSEAPPEGKLSLSLVRDCALAFNDYRLITQLGNEFSLYKRKLAKDVSLSLNKLFALMVVKTLHPELYAQLALDDGPIKKVFLAAREQRKNAQAKLQEKLDELREQLIEREKVFSQSKEELLTLYWSLGGRLSAQNPSPNAVNIEYFGNEAGIHALKPGSTFEKALLEGRRLGFTDLRGQIMRPTVSPTEIRHHKGLTYSESVSRLDTNVAEVSEQIRQVEYDLARVRHYSISKLLRLSDCRAELFKSLKDKSPIVELLLIQGHLEEDYADYMSYFYPGSMSVSDKNNVLEIKRGNKLPVDTEFSQPKAVLENLTPLDLEDGMGLLAELMPAMLLGPAREKLLAAIRGVERYQEELVSIWELLDGRNQKQLMSVLLKVNRIAIRRMLDTLNSALVYPHEDMANFIVHLVNEAGPEGFSDMKEVIGTISRLPTLEGIPIEQKKPGGAWDWFVTTGEIQYQSLTSITDGQAARLLSSGQFVINKRMITELFNRFRFDHPEASRLSYNSVLIAGEPKLKEKIDSALPAFFNVISDFIDWKETKESALAFIEVGKTELDIQQCVKVAKAYPEEFDAESFDLELSLTLLSEDKITPTWQNIFHIWKECQNQLELEGIVKSYAPIIIDFIGRHSSSIKGALPDDLEGLREFEQFMVSLLSTDVLSKVLYVLPVVPETLGGDLPREKWLMLAEHDSFEFSTDVFRNFQAASCEAGAAFLLKHWAEVTPESHIELEDETAFILLTSPIPTSSDKVNICNHFDLDFADKPQVINDCFEQFKREGAELPSLDSSFMQQVAYCCKDEHKCEIAHYYIEKYAPSWNETSKVLQQLAIKGFEWLDESEVPKAFTVTNAESMKLLVAKLKELDFVGSSKVTTKGLTVYTKPTMYE